MRQQGDRLRRAIRKLHLWLGLGLGGLLVLLGLTGSVLVFYPELDAMLHPEIRQELRLAGEAPPDWNRALATVRAEFPDKHGPWRFEVIDRSGAIPARYYNPPEREGHAFRPLMVWLSPDGSAVLRRDYWGEYAVTFVYDLHYRLLLGETGGKIVGWAGLPLLGLLLSGLWAWWPRAWSRASWGKALRFKRQAHQHRTLRDWHKLAGLGGSVFLILLTGTGIMLSLPEESDAVLGAAGLPVDQMPHVHPAEVAAGADAQIAPSQAVAAARAVFPEARLAWIEAPAASGGIWRLRMQVPGDPSFRFPHSYVWVDGASGTVLAVQDARHASAGSTVNAWLHPLHDGSAGGLAGRILATLAGLVPLLLFVTGWLRWRSRRRARR